MKAVLRVLNPISVLIFVLFCGCSEDAPNRPGTGVIVDRGFSLIRSAVFETESPLAYATGDTLEISLLVSSRYAGLGRVFVVGNGGGSAVGDILGPISATLGVAEFEAPLTEGDNRILFTVLMSSTLSSSNIYLEVSMDSLQVGGRHVHWESAEGSAVFHDDIPPNTAFLFNHSTVSLALERVD